MGTDLSKYDNRWFTPGHPLKRMAWHYVNCIFFKSGYFPFYRLKVFLLRLFGAKVGVGVLVKPFVHIKYPWLLQLGNHIWIGEHVWIDNIAMVTIGSHACISQGAYLLTGNHNYKKSTFDLLPGSIVLEEGVWLGAKCIVCPGITCGSHSILAVGSVATAHLEAWYIYQGNPAVRLRPRVMEDRVIK